ncbi:Cytoskeleton-associated protein 1 Cytoskeleton-associated protein CKAPI Tubulin-specific chaperone [Collichthys lucidus]|uniref:Cytoskeleton-associated protein 1 Cytoskeleton-associated protein CKAPI Tubulin-specific chaperone n=1 Tax=Collichthys lucidus TaxID=240159 RepID=A0A4U5V4H4_COLLU|nr:Cytoskeleton-associated protein 1 Cytoskeleton-associated protein CKAPI Tubulin-specific chaperone [Collichthys lucidus]
MDSGLTVVTNPTVNVRLTSTISSFEVQRKLNRGITLANLKGRLEMVVGVSPSCMDLELYSVFDKFMLKMDDNEALLGSYPVDNNCRIHYNPPFFSSETARSFMKKNRLSHYNEEEVAKKKAELAARQEEQKAAANAISVGNRCKVQVPGQPSRLGTVMYVGTTDFKTGHWVGVKYDEPVGKNNGTVDGKQYFECENKYGGFVKPLSVIVGDFPEEDYGLDEM